MGRKKKLVLTPADSDDIAKARARTTVAFTSFGAETSRDRLRSSKQFILVDPTSSSHGQSPPVLDDTPVFDTTPVNISELDDNGFLIQDEVGLDPAYVEHTKTVFAASNRRANVSVRDRPPPVTCCSSLRCRASR